MLVSPSGQFLQVLPTFPGGAGMVKLILVYRRIYYYIVVAASFSVSSVN